MKILFIGLIAMTLFSACSESLKQNETKSSIRILTSDEVGKLERKNAKTININYGADVNIEKEVTTKEYYEMLEKLENENSQKQIFQVLKEVYKQLSEQTPNKLIKIPVEVSTFDCGGCGCATPDKAGYASCTGNTCWCACCPR